MRRWSELAERLAATTRTSEKTAILADYFGTLTAEELPIAAVFLTGRPFAEADQRAAGLGWSAIASTVTDLGNVPRSALGEAYDRSSGAGRLARGEGVVDGFDVIAVRVTDKRAEVSGVILRPDPRCVQ